MEYPKIALLTDFGIQDPYVGIMKGVISSINLHADILDITHNAGRQNIPHAAFLLEHSYEYFPFGTIFVAVVDPGVGTGRMPLAVKTERFFFIAPDNGILAPALENQNVERIIAINNKKYINYPPSHTFHGRDIFAPAAAHLSLGIPIEYLGDPVDRIQDLQLPRVVDSGDHLTGHVLFADSFGNLVTNIRKSRLNNRRIRGIQAGARWIEGINKAYDHSPQGELLAIVGSCDTLEIAVNRGSALEMLRNEFDGTVQVFFKVFNEHDYQQGQVF